MNLLSSLLKYTADQIAALRAKNTSQDSTVSGINTRLTTAEGDIDSLEAQFTTVVSAVTTDTEVTNIRVGDDSVTYDTAGNAVRKQFSNVKSAIGQNYIIPKISGWVDGEYIKLDGTVGTHASYHRTDYIEINPNLGAIAFTNSGGMYDVKYNAWYDENKVFIASFSTAQNDTIKVQPPFNAKYMRLSFNSTTTNTISVNYYPLFNRINDIVSGNVFRRVLEAADFAQGIWNASGQIESNYNNRIRSAFPIVVKKGDCITYSAPANESWGIAFKILGTFPSDTAQTPLYQDENWRDATNGGFVCAVDGYLCINIRNTATDITPNDYDLTIRVKAEIGYAVENNTSKILTWSDLSSYVRSKFVTHMSHDGAGGYIQFATRNAIVSPLMFEFDVAIVADSGYKFAVQYFDGYEIGQSHLTYAGGWETSGIVVPARTYFCIIVAHTDDSNTDDHTQDNLTFYGTANLNDVYDKLMPIFDKQKAESVSPTNYVVGSDLMKQRVDVDYLGTLTYLQAFCIYNGNYYSINGTNISVQDGSFNEIDSATLDTGHGNGLQLGNSKYAYASGWNDNKIYKVDLENLVVDSVITLPTTGYTTGVVDEAKNLAYIFQRDSYPDHEDNYNFIVYDLTNQQIVSTKKILAYGAMQSADFFNDRIIVLNGLGSGTCPNGYRVFDTNGNILADYFFGDFSNIEPEGVCIDRDNHELFISFVDKKLYKVY